MEHIRYIAVMCVVVVAVYVGMFTALVVPIWFAAANNLL